MLRYRFADAFAPCFHAALADLGSVWGNVTANVTVLLSPHITGKVLLFEGLDGHRPADQESLYLITLQQSQLAELFLGLDTLGDDLELQCMRQIDND
jgi:hypothetical protein